MRVFDRGLALLGLTAALFVLGGCGDGKPSVDTTRAVATVKGVVTLDGAPVKKGMVSFNPANYLRKDVPSGSGEIKEDGSYELKTLAGENEIKVTGPQLAKDPVLSHIELDFTAKPGENTFNIELKKSK